MLDWNTPAIGFYVGLGAVGGGRLDGAPLAGAPLLRAGDRGTTPKP